MFGLSGFCVGARAPGALRLRALGKWRSVWRSGVAKMGWLYRTVSQGRIGRLLTGGSSAAELLGLGSEDGSGRRWRRVFMADLTEVLPRRLVHAC